MTLLILRLLSLKSIFKNAINFKYHLNPVVLVFVVKLLLSTNE